MTSWQIPTQKYDWKTEPIIDTSGFENSPAAWLAEHARGLGPTVFFLGFADDGVFCGEVRGGKLVMSDGVDIDGRTISPPALLALTFQQGHLFGTQGEVRIWRQNGGFRASQTIDTPGGSGEAFDQDQILFGTEIAGVSKNDFFLLQDGRQGLRYAVPVHLGDEHFQHGKLYRPMRLKIRYYLNSHSTDQTFIEASRLVNLFAVKEGKIR